ncbi:fungal cellulose binding domain-containing protein [Magnaporthiopsis poae ATCC 64411]|uniref:feruloyl esterase n=1 Tax=Magnaporthiopsis poae (strain ATCC 64411 / 73-15) TaxID=644358 RepID=A0A0C4EGM6_MAGP6|nr:fungal cellulose binding domain-containing protein [Magnaporthiopsis poae ATCC 64411]
MVDYGGMEEYAHKLIFTFHALGGTAQQIANGGGGTIAWYGLPPLSNNSAVFVSPNGFNNGWANQGGQDITFVDNIIKAVEADLCIETSLRFATGFSYGGAISFAWACARPKEVRAIAPLSSSQLSGCQGGTEPVAYYGQHGTSDSVLNVSGGRAMRDRFVRLNGCTPVSEPQPNGGRHVKVEYKNCKEGYPVTWVIHNGDHNPSQSDQGSNVAFAPRYSWDFFNQFQAQ